MNTVQHHDCGNSSLRVLFIGDSDGPIKAFKFALERRCKEESIDLTFGRVVHPRSHIASDNAVALISNDETWFQFHAMVLDVKWTADAPLDKGTKAGFEGLTVVWTKLLAHFTQTEQDDGVELVGQARLPWKMPYLSTIYFGREAGGERAELERVIKEVGFPRRGNVFGAVDPNAYKHLVDTIISDFRANYQL